MKKLLSTVLLASLAWTAPALDQRLEQKAERLFSKLDAMQAKPDKRVPADVLKKAQAIVLLDRTKAGFIFAYQGGGGVAMVRDAKGRWSPLAWVKADEASLGFQIGGQQSFLVILFMNQASAKTLIEDSTFEFGGEARGTGGNTSAGVEGKVDSVERAVLVYDDRSGLFGGAAVKGGAIAADHNANRSYYGAELNMHEILFERKVVPTGAAKALATKVEKFAKAG